MNAIISAQVLKRIGLRAIAMIRERTLQGRDQDGNAFAPYSTKTIAVPAGSLTKRAIGNLTGKLQWIKQRNGALWAIVEGGYAAIKAATYPTSNGDVNLTATGRMLRALTVIQVDERSLEVVIGFSRQEEAIKARWHQIEGPGGSKQLRKFLGLTGAERAELTRMATAALSIRT